MNRASRRRIKKRNKSIDFGPPTKRKKEKCKICKEPMLVAPGQVAYYHKACRKLRHNKDAKK